MLRETIRKTDAKQAKNFANEPLVFLVSLFRETSIHRFVKNPDSCRTMRPKNKHPDSKSINVVNPIPHTVWLRSHAVTLKKFTAKTYEIKKF
jgi:hypothetical protein